MSTMQHNDRTPRTRQGREDAAAADEDWMARYVAAIPAVLRGKKRMIEKKLTRARAKCPVCQKDEALNLGLASNRRAPSGFHLRWHCQCGFQGME